MTTERPALEDLRDTARGVTVEIGDEVVLNPKGRVRPYDAFGRDIERRPRVVAEILPGLSTDAEQRVRLIAQGELADENENEDTTDGDAN